MKSLSRRPVLLLASAAAAVTSLTVLAPPAALAGTTAAATSVAFASSDVLPNCPPAHWGREWKWHDRHWDHWEWDRWSNRAVWKHYWRDDRYCDGDQAAEASPLPEPDS